MEQPKFQPEIGLGLVRMFSEDELADIAYKAQEVGIDQEPCLNRMTLSEIDNLFSGPVN
jgi:hypothetical protein